MRGSQLGASSPGPPSPASRRPSSSASTSRRASRPARRSGWPRRRGRLARLRSSGARSDRLRALVGVLAVAALVAAGLTVFAFQQSNHSKHETKIATARQLAAASVANLDVDPELSILLGLRAVETTGGGARALPAAVDALHRARRGFPRRRHDPGSGRRRSPSARTGRGWRRQARRSRSGARRPAAGSSTSGAVPARSTTSRSAADGSRLAGASTRGRGDDLGCEERPADRVAEEPGARHRHLRARVQPRGNGARRRRRCREPVALGRPQPARAADDPHRASAVRRLVEPGRQAASPPATAGRITQARWRGSGTPRPARLVFASELQNGAIRTIAYSPNGEYLGAPNRLGVRPDLRHRRPAARSRRSRTTPGRCSRSRSAPTAIRAVTGSTDGTARVWDAATGRQLLVLRGHRAAVSSVAFAAGGTRVATASQDGTVRIWDVTTQGSRDWLTLARPSGRRRERRLLAEQQAAADHRRSRSARRSSGTPAPAGSCTRTSTTPTPASSSSGAAVCRRRWEQRARTGSWAPSCSKSAGTLKLRIGQR